MATKRHPNEKAKRPRFDGRGNKNHKARGINTPLRVHATWDAGDIKKDRNY